MSSSPKYCSACGAQIELGLARCSLCGTKVGTVFTGGKRADGPDSKKRRRRTGKTLTPYQAIERARERANNAFILALASFFCPVLGLAVATGSIMLGVNALQTFRQQQIEEGRGAAMAGITIGALGLIAQFFYTVYLITQGIPVFGN